MKTQNNDINKAANRGSVEKTLRARIMSPQQVSNMIFSAAHRILAIALRRGVIEGIETLDEIGMAKSTMLYSDSSNINDGSNSNDSTNNNDSSNSNDSTIDPGCTAQTRPIIQAR
ncbi:hypothetical protein V493_05469 [Pseudogymnoascus sp. VKM F-4281 (FW-2241)]|nr:hypothetical protein V493_05469 [Pseudogymnoascus sp. VKM F-4281 (FW-2241)]